MKPQTYDKIISELKVDEGCKLIKYLDSEGHLTIGYGTLITNMDEKELHYLGCHSIDDVQVITQAHAEWLLMRRFNYTLAELREKVPIFDSMPDTVQEALANMAYNMGVPRLLGFKKMLAALKEHRWIKAGNEAEDSVWFTQVGNRGPRIVAKLMDPAY